MSFRKAYSNITKPLTANESWASESNATNLFAFNTYASGILCSDTTTPQSTHS